MSVLANQVFGQASMESFDIKNSGDNFPPSISGN